MFEFDLPWIFVLLPAPLLVWWLMSAYRERQESVRVPFFEKVAAVTGIEPSRGGVQLRRNVLQGLIAPLAWALIVTALARPQYVEPPIEKIESARDLMLAVDLSGSMDTPDMLDAEGQWIQRLDAVKFVLDDFISRREGDRLGVIVFGNQAQEQDGQVQRPEAPAVARTDPEMRQQVGRDHLAPLSFHVPAPANDQPQHRRRQQRQQPPGPQKVELGEDARIRHPALRSNETPATHP